MKRITALTTLAILTVFLALSPGIAAGAEKTDIDKRIDKLEKKIKKLENENKKLQKSVKGIVHSEDAEAKQLSDYQKKFDEFQKKTKELKEVLDQVEVESLEAQESMVSNFVKISGYADAEFRLTNSDNDNNRFRIRHLSVFLSKKVHEKWKFFSEIEFEDAPKIESIHTTDDADTVQGKILVEQTYIEYQPQLGLELRFGRFITPAGYWNIYHYYPYVPTQTRPLFVRKIFPSYSDGIQVRKAISLADSMLDTHFYVANGSGNPGRLDRNNEKAFGGRLNISKDLLDGFDAGISFYTDLEEDEVLLDKVRKNSYALHLKLAHGDYTFQTEYATRTNSPDESSDYDDTGFYAQLSYDMDKWTFAGRYDWYDVNDSIPDADQYRYTVALNYHFAHNVIGKIEYGMNEFDDPADEDFNELITAIVIAIGDL